MTLVIEDELVESLCRDHSILTTHIQRQAAHLEQLDRELNGLCGGHPMALCGPYTIVRCNVGVVVLNREETDGLV